MSDSNNDPSTGQSHYDDNDLISLIQFHSIDIVVGTISSFICALTLLVFISSKQFLCQNKLLTQLAAADLCTSVGILALGLMRKALYTSVMETSRVPVETSWTCAGKPFVYLRLLGAVIPPGIVLWISCERFFAVYASSFYRRHITKHANIPPMVIFVYTVLAVLIAYLIAWLNRNRGAVESYCGRKNAFTKGYTTYVYVADVLGFVIALLINCITLCRLGRMYAQRENRYEVKKQLRRINYLLVISFVSTLTVAIPNGISLVSAFFGRLNIWLLDPANWMIATKCSINFFVYLLLKADFRQRVYEILGCLSVDQLHDKDRAYELSGATGPIAQEQQQHQQHQQQHRQQNNATASQSRSTSRMTQARESITVLHNVAGNIAGGTPICTARPRKSSLVVPNGTEERDSLRRAWTTSTQFRVNTA